MVCCKLLKNICLRILVWVVLVSLSSGLNKAWASGSIAGNPADNNPSAKSLVWFLGEQPVRWCVHLGNSKKLYTSSEKSIILIQEAINYWRDYLKIKKLKDEWYANIPFINLNNEFRERCKGDEDLTFFIGSENAQIEKLKKQYKNPSGFAELLNYDEEKGWGKGLIWIKEYIPEGSASFGEFKFVSLILHELGHVLGCGHVEGTIMSSDLVTTLNSLEKISQAANYKLTTNIDLQKELFFSTSRGIQALSYFYLKPNIAQKMLAKILLGVEIESPFFMGFIQGEDADYSRAKLFISYEGLEPLVEPKILRGVEIKEGGKYIQRKKLKGNRFELELDMGTLIRFSTSDNSIFRVLYKGKEMSLKVPGYLVQGKIKTENGDFIPIVYGRNKGDGEYIRISAIINQQQELFFEANLMSQPYW